MIANIRPWSLASPDDHHYSNFLVDRTILYDTLLISDTAYALLTKIFSPRLERRPSLDEIRREVLEMDIFFPTDEEVARYGWSSRIEKKLQQKMCKCGMSAGSSDDTSSGSCYSCTSASYNSSGSSSSAFESISLESRPFPVTPPAPAVEFVHSSKKAPSRLELGLRVVVAQTV
jgi:hypothetical protein